MLRRSELAKRQLMQASWSSVIGRRIGAPKSSLTTMERSICIWPVGMMEQLSSMFTTCVSYLPFACTALPNKASWRPPRSPIVQRTTKLWLVSRKSLLVIRRGSSSGAAPSNRSRHRTTDDLPESLGPTRTKCPRTSMSRSCPSLLWFLIYRRFIFTVLSHRMPSSLPQPLRKEQELLRQYIRRGEHDDARFAWKMPADPRPEALPPSTGYRKPPGASNGARPCPARSPESHSSGWRDLNPRHPAPKAGALPSCATARCANAPRT